MCFLEDIFLLALITRITRYKGMEIRCKKPALSMITPPFSRQLLDESVDGQTHVATANYTSAIIILSTLVSTAVRHMRCATVSEMLRLLA